MSQGSTVGRQAAGTARPSMLVVDDDRPSRKLLEGLLRKEGYRVRGACDGPEALGLVSEELPDVVLLDVMMPRMTGYEVCEKIKSDTRTRSCQVMLVTALDGTRDKVQGLDTGADDHLAKPVRRDEFLAKVRALVRARRLLLDLEHARGALAARSEELELKKTLAESLVHDLKNPLAAVLGNLDLLEMRVRPDLRPLVQRSKQGARRMLKMIVNLLDVEKLEQGRLEPERQRLDATGIVGAAVAEAKAAAGLSRVEVVFDADGPSWTHADPVLIRRVVDNLLLNAVAHSPTGGTVRAGVRHAQSAVEISVEDEGPGIPAPLRERVFEKYARADLKQSGVSANRGLGLTFCRLAVESHGGKIWVESGSSGGARLCVSIPEAGLAFCA